MRLGGSQSRFVRFEEEKYFLSLPGLEPRTLPMTANQFDSVGTSDYTKFCCTLSKSLWANAGTPHRNLNKLDNVRITTAAVEKQQVLHINQTWIFSTDFQKNPQISNPPSGSRESSCFIRTDRRTDMAWHDTTFLSTSYAICHSQLHIKENATDGTCSKHVRSEKRFQCRNRKPWIGETNWKACVQIGG
jgi:hypothetical protein